MLTKFSQSRSGALRESVYEAFLKGVKIIRIDIFWLIFWHGSINVIFLVLLLMCSPLLEEVSPAGLEPPEGSPPLRSPAESFLEK